MNKKKTWTILAILALIAVVALGVAYAAFSTTLNISGTGEVAPNSWDIHFENLKTGVATGYAVIDTEPTFTTTTISGFDFTFKAPGDSVSWEFDVVNGSADLNAILTTITKGTAVFAGSGTSQTADEGLVSSNFTYTLKYKTPDALVANNDTLAKATTKTLVLTATFSGVATDMPVEKVEITGLSYQLIYDQTT